MLGFTGAFQPFIFFSTITTARITLPTGNANAQDFDYYIPMGYGGYTASVQETLSIGRFKIGPITARLFISGTGIYYFESEQKIDTVEKNTYEPSYAWAAMGGLEFGITENLDIQVKGNYINVSERKYENNATPDIEIDANDSLTQVNILPFIKYRFLDDISGRAGIIYPVKSNQDSDITKTYDAKWKIAFGIEKRFNNENSMGREKTVSYDKFKNQYISESVEVVEKASSISSKKTPSSRKKRKRRK